MGLRLTGMLALTGAILGFFVSLALPHRYLATTTLRFIPGASVPENIADTLATRLVTPETLNSVISRESNLKEMLNIYSNYEVFDILRAGSRVRPARLPQGARGLEVTFEDDNAERALGIDQALANTAVQLTAENGQDLAELLGTPHTQLTGATPGVTTGIGFALGLAAGLAVWAIAVRMA